MLTQLTTREIVFCAIAGAILLALLLSGCSSAICADGVTFGYDPNNPSAMCAYDRAGNAIACGLTPEQVVRACPAR